MLENTHIKTRFAPSPTGLLHAGNYRTAVFSYLVAKKSGGSFVLRIEDTDQTRSKKEYEDNIMESLSWLDLPWDEFSRQSDKRKEHRDALEHLLATDAAYISREEGEGEIVREVIRFKNPGEEVSFTDIIRGEICINTADLGDFVIAKSIDEPLFHLAVVVDDATAGITHVIRGEDHISNTPRHILIQRALGVPTPHYAHLPLILAPNRTKLSKRTGARALTEYRDEGILPEAMFNYLALLGWHPQDEREVLSREDLIREFSLDRVQKGGAIFDEMKLLSLNQHWLRALSDREYIARGERFFASFDSVRLTKVASLLKERARTFKEARELLHGELAGIFEKVSLSRDVLVAKEPPEKPLSTGKHLTELVTIIQEIPPDARAEEIKSLLMPYADKEGRAAVLWPLRYALSGQERSPDPFTLVSLLGKEESLRRLRDALVLLKS